MTIGPGCDNNIGMSLSRPATGNVLVLDGMWNKSLAAVRSLGGRGLRVTAGEHTVFAASIFSRHCARRVIYPSPASSPRRFMKWLRKELERRPYDMVFPTELSTQLLLAKNRDTVEALARLPFADPGLTENIHDKAWLLRHAASVGVPCPTTEIFDDMGRVHADFAYPVVIKPRASSGSRGLVYVKSKDEFMAAYRAVHVRYPFPIVQEHIPNGGAYGVGALFNADSEPRAAFVYQRLREYPVTGGPSTLRKSVKHNEIKDLALHLLKTLNWTGLAHVEFRVDARDGTPRLMEVNPRVWGSLHLPIIAGMDFPHLLYKMAMDGDIRPQWYYKTGVRCRWLIPGDLLHLASSLRRLSVPRGFFERNDGDDIISADDPLPVIGRISSFLPLLYSPSMWKMLKR